MKTYDELKAEKIKAAWIAEIGKDAFELLQVQINYQDGGLIVIGEFDLLKQTREILGDKLQETDKFKFDGRNLHLVSLSGIENNHGWTRIEADGSNCPKSEDENDRYELGMFDSGIWRRCIDDVEDFEVIEYYRDCGFTHYKPIEKSLPPLV